MSSPAHHLTDFSDRLSPMLVKELRQGMRTHLFTVAFILLQAFMVLCVLIAASAPNDPGTTGGFFWFFVVVSLLIVMPIRGFGALSSEIQLNTMDLIQLTRLGAWRVTFGKWAALVAQSALLVCGVLPYLVMRYFFGGIDLFQELSALFWLFVASMLFTAVTVGFSAFRSVLLRATVSTGLFILVIVLVRSSRFFIDTLFDPASAGMSTSAIIWTYAAGLLTAVYVGWFMLDLGASRIAPEADNHATRKRLLALAFGIVVLCLPFFGMSFTICLAIAGVTWVLVSLDALTEQPTLLPSILLPFESRPWLRPFTLLLTPGWPSGIFFFLLCAGLFAGALELHAGLASGSDEEILFAVSAAAMVVFPMLVIHLFFRKITEPAAIFGIYLLIQICTLTVAFLLKVMAKETQVEELAYFFAPLPATGLAASTGGLNAGTARILLMTSAGFGLLAVITTIIRGVPWYRDTFRIMSALRSAAKQENV